MFFEGGLRELTESQIAFALAPFAKQDDDIEKCVRRARQAAENSTWIEREAAQVSGTSPNNLKDVGNTLINHMEITGLFDVRSGPKRLILPISQRERAERILANVRQDLIPYANDEARYQTAYGGPLMGDID